MFQILALALVFIGYLIGVKCVLVAQISISLLILLFLNSTFVKRKEVAGVAYIAGGLCVFIGMGLGDIVYLIGHGIPPSITEALKWLASV